MLIGISGARQSGKTTLGTLLASKYGMKHTSFAEPMRKFVADILGVSTSELEAIKEKPVDWLDGKTPREMLQSVGTEWGRLLIHNEIWTRSALQRSGDDCVLSDVRFQNEAKVIRDSGGFVIRVRRDAQLEIGSHTSETPLPTDLVDIEITNNTTPEAMLAAVERHLFPAKQENPAADPDVLAYSAPGCPATVVAGD